MFPQRPRNALLPMETAAASQALAGDPALMKAHGLLVQAAQNHAGLLQPAEDNATGDDDATLSVAKSRLVNAIGAAALLSNTPQKWAATIGLLHRNGIDPQGYEDFWRGRPAAIASAGLIPEAGRPITEMPTG